MFTVIAVMKAAGFTLADLKKWGGKVISVPRPSHPDRREAIQSGTVNAVFDEGIKSWGQTAIDSGFTYLPIEGQILRRLAAMGYQTSVVPKSRFKGMISDVPTVDFSGWPMIVHADLPNDVEGLYLILLRIEATDDKEGDSNLGAVGAGLGIVHSGAVAGFPLPVLRYLVGSGGSELAQVRAPMELGQLLPADDAILGTGAPFDFVWADFQQAGFYRIEFEDSRGQRVLSAIVPSGVGRYRAPPWLADKAAGSELKWRVVALDVLGNEILESGWRRFRFARPRPQ